MKGTKGNAEETKGDVEETKGDVEETKEGRLHALKSRLLYKSGFRGQIYWDSPSTDDKWDNSKQEESKEIEDEQEDEDENSFIEIYFQPKY